MKLNKFSITAATTTLFTVVLNIAAFFFLPETMVTQIGFSSVNRMPTAIYLLLSAFIIALSAGMVVFSDKHHPNKKTKWFAVNLVVSLLNVVIIIYNLIK